MATMDLVAPMRRSRARAIEPRADFDLRKALAAARKAWFARLRVRLVCDEMVLPPVMRLLGSRG